MPEDPKQVALIKALADFVYGNQSYGTIEMSLAWELLFRLHKHHIDWQIQNPLSKAESKK